MGALLTAALSALIALSFHSSDGRVVLVAGGALMLLAVRELAHMGRFARYELGLPLAVAAVGELTARWSSASKLPIGASEVLVGMARPLLLALATAGAARLVLAFRVERSIARLVACGMLLLLVVTTRAGERAGSATVCFWGATLLGASIALGEALRAPETRAELALLAAVAPWVVFPLPALTDVWRGFGPRGLLALIALSKIGDVAGYYVGNAIGQHHPFPRTSPGKTTAGCVASLVAGTLCGGIAVAVDLLPDRPLGLAGGLLAGALVNLAAQAGDLLESRAKRWAGVKDASNWFGPSGGVLDLVDSLLLSVPAALLTWPLLFASS